MPLMGLYRFPQIVRTPLERNVSLRAETATERLEVLIQPVVRFQESGPLRPWNAKVS